MKKEYIKVKISELKNWEKNPKKHDEKLIENSIKEFGYIEPIIIDEKNKIIVGHGRLKVLKKLGIEEVEAIRIEGLNEKQKEKYALLANRAVERGGWDWELLLSFDEEVLRESGFEIFEEKIEDKEIKEEEEKQFEKEVYCVVTFKNNEEIINFFKMFSVEESNNLIEYVIIPKKVIEEQNIKLEIKELGGRFNIVFKNKTERENFFRLLKIKSFGEYKQIKWEDIKKLLNEFLL